MAKDSSGCFAREEVLVNVSASSERQSHRVVHAVEYTQCVGEHHCVFREGIPEIRDRSLMLRFQSAGLLNTVLSDFN